jgi:hypothetical protein
LINTPTMDRIAKGGIAYNRFHTTAMCSPTRAALLCGRNHHRVDSGQIAELANDWDAYSGIIPKSSATVAEVLKDYGYATSAFGKWHNTPAEQTTAAGPFEYLVAWPRVSLPCKNVFVAGAAARLDPDPQAPAIEAVPGEHFVNLLGRVLGDLNHGCGGSKLRPIWSYINTGYREGQISPEFLTDRSRRRYTRPVMFERATKTTTKTRKRVPAAGTCRVGGVCALGA